MTLDRNEISHQKQKTTLTCKIPIRLRSIANIKEHWAITHKRNKKIKQLLHCYLPDLSKCHLPCKVTLTRVAPRCLDTDNLYYAFKFVVDEVCDMLMPGLARGRADGTGKIKIEYKQERGKPKEYAIIVRIKSELTE